MTEFMAEMSMSMRVSHVKADTSPTASIKTKPLLYRGLYKRKE